MLEDYHWLQDVNGALLLSIIMNMNLIVVLEGVTTIDRQPTTIKSLYQNT